MVSRTVMELVDALSVDEQVELINHLHRSWALRDSPLSEEDKRVLDERIADMEANPGGGLTLDDFMSQVRAGL
jgi:putative addiction module component (TIGR02574 family)